MIEINWKPSRKELTTFSLLLIVFFGIVSWLAYRRTGSSALASTLFVTAATIGIIGLIVPAFMRWVYVVWMVAVFPIGWLVSHVLLALVFFGVVTPIGWLLRLFSGDPMQRRFEPTTKTYWQPRQPRDRNSYFRQF